MRARDRERGMKFKSCRRKAIQQYRWKGKGVLEGSGGVAQKITQIQTVVSPGILEGNVLATGRLRNAQPLS